MALTFRTLYKNCNQLHIISKPLKWNIGKNYTTRILAGGICYPNRYFHEPLLNINQINVSPISLRQCSTKQEPDKAPENKKGLITKLKEMYKNYWYVVVPVHMATSCIWFGSFYYAVRSGVDVVHLLQAIGISETIITPLKESTAGYFALTLALYKLATPLRYAVTVGGTTYAIKKLTSMGWIKPVPSRERLKEIYIEKKGNIQGRINESKQQYQSLKEKKCSQVMEEMKRYKLEMRNLKEKVKKT